MRTFAAVLACLLAASQALADGGGAAYDENAPTSLLVRGAAMLNRTLHINGRLQQAAKGERIVVQRLLATGAWATIARARADAEGRFATTWRTDHIGRMPLRALPASGAGPQATAHVTVFRATMATWFGPGFFGKQTACGLVLDETTQGVAHRTLPCGTLVDLYYKGRALTVAVVDRGPYGEKASWDLTQATAQALGFTHTDRLGAARVR